MSSIKRKSFLKMSALAMMAPFANSAAVRGAYSGTSFLFKDNIVDKLIAANDKQVAGLLQSVTAEKIIFSRKIGYDFAALAAAYVTAASQYYHSDLLAPKMELLANAMASQQTADGTVNIGNLESPPDTAFLVELLSAAAVILKKDNSSAVQTAYNTLKKFLLNAGEGLTAGGVHTPNHRWVVCAALAKLNALYPNKKYTNRIQDWLGEGIYMDADGHYPERSAGIYAGVENNSIITMARQLNKPALFDYARKNLEMTYYYMEPNGDMVTNDSRRQDQYLNKNIVAYYYLSYRYMAIKDGNKKFAALTRQMEGMKNFEEDILNKGLFYFLEDTLLQESLPDAVMPSDNYEKLFTSSHLLRIRRGNTTATLFGGVDWPLVIASGRCNSPDFFAYRKGNAILKYMRLSTSFFGMGYFYSEGLKKEGKSYLLHKKITAPYYQPLPKNLRNKAGDYTLVPSTDDRFWNKMDFAHRPVSNVKTQETTISFTETNGAVELTIDVKGLSGVPVTIELCFGEGGSLSGVSAPENGNSFLEKDFATYFMGGDEIRFGPGIMKHKRITDLEGERYSTHFGSLRTEGMHVYLTGLTPFTHTISFK